MHHNPRYSDSIEYFIPCANGLVFFYGRYSFSGWKLIKIPMYWEKRVHFDLMVSKVLSACSRVQYTIVPSSQRSDSHSKIPRARVLCVCHKNNSSSYNTKLTKTLVYPQHTHEHTHKHRYTPGIAAH